MKIDLLKKALTGYASMVSISDQERDEAIKAIAECTATTEHYINYDIFDGTVELLPTEAVCDFLNQETYDVYGRLYKVNDRQPAFQSYADECRKLPGFNQFTNAQLEIGYEYLTDLWSDNESLGCNNPDGTFKG